jgi:hypothetical protein
MKEEGSIHVPCNLGWWKILFDVLKCCIYVSHIIIFKSGALFNLIMYMQQLNAWSETWILQLYECIPDRLFINHLWAIYRNIGFVELHYNQVLVDCSFSEILILYSLGHVDFTSLFSPCAWCVARMTRDFSWDTLTCRLATWKQV